jgi:hypothetical protein
MSSVQLLQVLKTQLVLFFDELIALHPEEKDFLVMRFFIKDQVPITEVMQYITRKLVPLESYIKNRDERFFLEHQVLFEELKDHNNSKVNYFKRMWLQSDAENKQVFWNWFQYFVTLAKKYSNVASTQPLQ